jgi:subtilase family serine protease
MMKSKYLVVRQALISLVFLWGIFPAFGAGWKTLSGHVPPVTQQLTATGQLPATNQLQLAIGLPLRDATGLDNFLAQVYDPASPNYHQYLTPEQFAEMFGPTEQDYEAVKSFAQANGLTVTTTYGNRLVLDVAGPAAAVERAFHITLRTYRHPTEARDFFAPDVEPTVDGALPAVDIQGLSNFWRPHPKLHRMDEAKLANAMPKTGSSPDGNGYYFGNDFRNAYVPGTTLTGAGQTVGLVEFDGFYSNDIAAYAAAAGNGRTNIVIQTNLLDGYNGVPTKGRNSGNPEVSLDIEMAMSMAPGLAKIVSFEAGPDGLQNDILNAMVASSNTVKTLSCSWTWGGGPSSTTDAIFENMAAGGQSFFQASGDSDAYTTGASSSDGVDNTSLDNAPCSSPYITQVGGTTLTMNGTGASYASETVWNWGIELGSSYDGVGSSGGISSYYSIPSWQTNVNNMAGRGGSASFRNIPDVALTADNVYVEYGNGKSSMYGGTSCATPLWAAFMALVNQQAAANGKPSAGFINPAIYAIAAGASFAACFHDVTTGNNTWSGSPSLFYATNGYDLCTGLGTPAGQNLINALAPASGLIVSPLSGAATGVAGGPFSITPGNFLLTNSSSSSLTWSLINTSTWLNFSATNGTVAAGAYTNLTCSLTATASNLVVGTYTGNLTFSNWTSHATEAGLFTLQVNQPLVVSPTNGFASSGPVGGPFNVTSQNFTLTNQSISSLPWSIINTSSWLSASPSSGTLAGSGQTTLTVSLTTAADSLTSGVYTTNVIVTNWAGEAASLPFTLNVGQSIVINGGFETGDFTGWTLVGNTVIGKDIYDAVESSSSFPDVVHSGTYGAFLGDTNIATLSQTLNTLPGQNYLLSFWLDNPTNGTGQKFYVNWISVTSNQLYQVSSPPIMSWTNFNFIVTAGSTTATIQFGAENVPNYFGLDDVSLILLPEPAFKTAQQTTAAFNLTWNAATGLVYQVQYTTNLLQTNWINLGQPLIATNASLTVSDTNAVNSSPQRFYRLIEQPQ